MARGLVLLCVALAATQLAIQASAQSSDVAKLIDLISKKKYDDFVEALSGEAIDVNQPDSKGRLPLVEAVKTGDIKYVDTLIQFGALANSREPGSKASPLQLAFKQGLVEVSKTLLAYGADVDAADKSGAKPRTVASNGEIKKLIVAWDKDGAQAFEDAPGTWTKTANDAGAKYWWNKATKESRWNVPPSCAWQRVEMNGQPHKYVNYITSQTVHKLPNALAWRLVHQQGQDLWYNYRANISQVARPVELPDDLFKQLSTQKNVRWYNPKTGEHSWEDPKFLTPWRELQGEGKDAKPYFFNVVTGETTWEAPMELAWKKVPSDDHPGREFYHNPVSGESTWDVAGIHGWEKHDSDL